MSALTLKLLRQHAPKNAKKWQDRVQEVASRLGREYGNPCLGNFRDPVKEIFYIVLSAKTNEANYQKAHEQLSTRFPTLRTIALAPLADIYECIAHAGLGSKRAAHLKAIATRLLVDFGRRPSAGLRKLNADQAYEYLRTLHGVGPKSALCVMMYSLGFDVFPVDTHVNRVMSRLGIQRKKLKHYHAQTVLPAYVPEGISKELHVALVVHGRQVCTPLRPRCSECVVRSMCLFGQKATQVITEHEQR